MDPVRIRRGVTSDASALAAFAARTFHETFAADNRPEDVAAHLASAFGVAQQTRELGDPNVATLLAFRSDTLVAFAQVRRKAPPPCVTQPRPIELQRFYVDRPAHGTGVAQTLMAAARKGARIRRRASVAGRVGAQPARDRVLHEGRLPRRRQHRVPGRAGPADRPRARRALDRRRPRCGVTRCASPRARSAAGEPRHRCPSRRSRASSRAASRSGP
ncbi:MAG: GNAT family N-acetyltransferase [Betaproteobacteria bacterium]|nr:GNAT family N-acetyltransferase [Betaproteobacteria bacterium]